MSDEKHETQPSLFAKKMRKMQEESSLALWLDYCVQKKVIGQQQTEINELVDILEETKMHLNPRWAKEELDRAETLIAKHRG